jgi:hypothetical protein
MPGDIIFQVFGVHNGREKDTYLGAFRTREEAMVRVHELSEKVMNGSNWAAMYHNQGFVVRPKTVETDFEVPPLPKPRDKYLVRTTETSLPGTWATTRAHVLRRGRSAGRTRADLRIQP